MKQQAKQQSRTEIVERPKEALSTVPQYLRRTDGAPQAGLENMDRQDMTLPRLGLCQSLSPQRIKSDPKYIPQLEEGSYFNTITREDYGGKVQVVPLLFYKSRLLFAPMDEGGGLRCNAPDALVGIGEPGGTCLRCPLQLFGKKGEPPACSLLYNYACLVVKDGRVSPDQLVVKSFKSSDLGAARDWNALIRIRNTDMFAGVYEFTSIEAKNDVGRWYKTTVQNVGWVSEAVYEAAKIAYMAVAELNKSGRLRHDIEDLSSGGEGGSEER